MIEIKNLTKSFKKNEVLKDFNLTIEKGSIFGLIGINGAGKTTLLRMLSGVYKADEGEILINGVNIYDNKDVKKQIFFLPDDPYYDMYTTGHTLKQLYSYHYDLDEALLNKHLETYNLTLNDRLFNLSKGMRRQMFISFALACKPKYLFLDEVFDGLDPLARLSFKKGLIELVEDNETTIIISSHSLRELEDICDSYGLIDNKQIVEAGSLDHALENLHTIQVVFEDQKSELAFEMLEVRRFVKIGRVIHMVVKGNKSEIEDAIRALNPIVLEFLPTTFESLFIAEVEKRGYLK